MCAVITLCVAGPLYAKPAAHTTAKSAAVKVAKVAHRSSAASTPYLQCVQFARQFTGMQIFGDAWTWWEKAAGKYDEGHAPKPGAVLVFPSQGRIASRPTSPS
ncbi:MAG: CHAP domain-containing protein, partial [Asticcacaulis sp.]